MKNYSNLHWLWLSALVIFIDQSVKFWINAHFAVLAPGPILPFVNIVPTQNTGAAFGLLSAAGGWQRWFLVAIAVVMSVVILAWLVLLPKKQTLSACGLALILGGALGNLYDRLVVGFVTDFIDLHVGSIHFPAYFNIADIAINVGVVLWIIGMIWQNKCSPGGA